jgi:hypothetical protein
MTPREEFNECVPLRARDMIQGESLSREPPLVCHFVPPKVVFHSSYVRRCSLSQPRYRVPSIYKTDLISHGPVNDLQMQRYEAYSRDSIPRLKGTEIGLLLQQGFLARKSHSGKVAPPEPSASACHRGDKKG